jgi:Domain of unknown function (DUF4145)
LPNTKNLWREKYYSFGNWSCPECGIGTLREDVSARRITEPEYSKAESHEDYFEPYMAVCRFTAQLICSDQKCGEIVNIIGGSKYEEFHFTEPDGADETSWDPVFFPAFSFPAILPVKIHGECPPQIIQEIKSASALIWADRPGALNKIRRCVEALLDFDRIKKTTINAHRKRVSINLHDRIVLLRKVKADYSEILLALKWLGNAGSHVGKVETTIPDLIEAFEILEHAIRVRFDNSHSEILKKAKRINSKRA